MEKCDNTEDGKSSHHGRDALPRECCSGHHI